MDCALIYAALPLTYDSAGNALILPSACCVISSVVADEFLRAKSSERRALAGTDFKCMGLKKLERISCANPRASLLSVLWVSARDRSPRKAQFLFRLYAFS
jgi:hypothetical protein